MSKLVDLLNTKKPADSKAKTGGIDKTPIGTEFPFQNSKDLVNSDLNKARYGELGNKAGGYSPAKKYTDTVTRK